MNKDYASTYPCPCPSVQRLRARQEKKKNRRRARCLVFLALLALVLLIVFATAANATRISDTDTLCVSNGDTLWSIAQRCNTNKQDTRRVMEDIMDLNHMKSASLNIGDKLIIPVY